MSRCGVLSSSRKIPGATRAFAPLLGRTTPRFRHELPASAESPHRKQEHSATMRDFNGETRDSNRGHHDFQAESCGPRTGPNSLQEHVSDRSPTFEKDGDCIRLRAIWATDGRSWPNGPAAPWCGKLHVLYGAADVRLHSAQPAGCRRRRRRESPRTRGAHGAKRHELRTPRRFLLQARSRRTRPLRPPSPRAGGDLRRRLGLRALQAGRSACGHPSHAICGPTRTTSGIGCSAQSGGSTPCAAAAIRPKWRSNPAGVQTSR
jgi:hypothetical protein